ncbi:hypothetical protein ACA910_015083 [Epithemia clementina (nom. ined.)]
MAPSLRTRNLLQKHLSPQQHAKTSSRKWNKRKCYWLWIVLCACACYSGIWIFTTAFGLVHFFDVPFGQQGYHPLVKLNSTVLLGDDSSKSYLQNFGTPNGVVERSRLRRETIHDGDRTNNKDWNKWHSEIIRRQQIKTQPEGLGKYINYLDGRKEFHPPHDARDQIIRDPDGNKYRVAKTGMLQKMPSITDLKSSNKKVTNNTRSYAPFGGELPQPQNSLSRSVVERFGEWPRVDQFKCLDTSTSTNIRSFFQTRDNGKNHNNTKPYFEWQTRAPYAIILGTMKGGTQALTTYLWQHKRFAKQDEGMEIHFFGMLDYHQSSLGIPVRENQKAYAYRYQKSHSKFFLPRKSSRTVALPNALALDSTPYYLLASDIVPQAICCVAPWAKLIAILRHPIDRVESHYRYLHESRWRSGRAMVDWETWIHHDLQLLRETGVVQDWNKVNFEEYSGSAEEFEAWKRYVHQDKNSQYVVGRGLYAIQVQHYLQVLAACPSINPRSAMSFMAVQSEEFRQHTNRVYNRVLEFLNLPPHNLTDAGAKHKTKKLGDEIPMPSHIQRELQDFYRPYNHRLYKLLNWTSSLEWQEYNDKNATDS